MSEYYYIMTRHNKYKNYKKNIWIFTVVMIIVISLVVFLDFVKINPFILYSIGLLITLFYAYKTKIESDYYQQLVSYLKEKMPSILENEELVFFLDYQLNTYFGDQSPSWFLGLKSSSSRTKRDANRDLCNAIKEINSYHEYLAIDTKRSEDTKLSLEWYTKSFSKRKNDLV